MISLHESITKFFKELDDQMTSYAPTRDLALKLAERGWFLTRLETIGFHSAAFDLIKEDKNDDVDLLFKMYIDEEIDILQNRLRSRYADLEDLIIQGFECHKNKMFYVSIPAFLILAEHICNYIVSEINGESTRNLLFNTDRRAKDQGFSQGSSGIRVNTEKHFDQIERKYSFNSHIPLLEKHFFNQDSSLNPHSRHGILHGESKDYGTELNSLKAICFMNYVDQTLAELKDKLNRKDLAIKSVNKS